MKKLFLTTAAIVAFVCSSQASIILSNSFAYADGPLVSGSAGSPLGVWVSHSGTANQVDVSAGVVTLTGSESEDVSTVLTNAAFPTVISNGTVYVSFDMNLSALPNSSVYFAHFRGLSTDFRARLFINPSSTSGKYQVGIVNFSSGPVYVPMDLEPGTTYKLVLKFVNSAAATLWIDPNAESNSSNRAIANDTTANTFGGCYYWAWRQSTGMGTFTVDNLLVATTFEEVALEPGAPTISPILKQSISANTSTGPLPFTVSDFETPATSLNVTGTSDNPTLIPNSPANITFAGAGNDRTVNITPAAGQEGSANVSLVVTDASSLTATTVVAVVVGAPSIASIPTQTTPAGTPFAPVAISVNDNETPNSLSVTATSSNPALIQDSKLSVTGTGTSRSLQITPEAGQTGLSTITVTVSDAFQSVSTTFTAAVSPQYGVILSDNFDYPDGLLSEVSSYKWLTYSPAPASNDCYVVSGKLMLALTNSDDVNALYNYNGGSLSIPASSGAVLYSKFKVNFSSPPVGSGGGYFAYFKEAGNTQFRARVFAKTNGAATGKFRLAISNGGFSEQAYPEDLALNTDYTVVTRFNTVSGIATLWVNPSTESSTSISGVDYAAPAELLNYSFRQDGKSGNIGVLSVDELLVGTAWGDVYTYVPPTPIPLSIQRNTGGTITLTWSNPAFKLQESSSATSGWTTLSSAASGYTVNAAGTKFYRLIATP